MKYVVDAGILFGIGLLIALFTEKKQSLHDIVAKTLVVERPKRRRRA